MKAWWLVLMLAGCAMPAALSYRDTEVPIGVSTRFEVARFAGDWWVRVSFADPAPRQLRLETGPDGTVQITAETGPVGLYDLTDGARLVPRTGGAELWVLWVDADYRSAGQRGRNGRDDPGSAEAGRDRPHRCGNRYSGLEGI